MQLIFVLQNVKGIFSRGGYALNSKVIFTTRCEPGPGFVNKQRSESWSGSEQGSRLKQTPFLDHSEVEVARSQSGALWVRNN